MATQTIPLKPAPLPVGQRLLENGLITAKQLEETLVECKRNNQEAYLIGRTLVEKGLITQSELLNCLFQQFTQERAAHQVEPGVAAKIRFKGVEKSFDGRKVLDGLDLEIPAHKITAIIGISGGGKSVTLKHMVGLMEPDKGEVWVDDNRLGTISRQQLNTIRKRFSLLFQGGALFDSLTVSDNVAFPLRETTDLSEAEIQQRVERSLKDVNLAGMEQKYPDELSGGMQKRAALARALVIRPDIILLDEPTAGLDPIIEKAIHYLICDTFMRTRYTMVIISHAVPAVFDWCHHVIVLHQGKVRAAGPSMDIRNSRDPVIRQFINGDLDGPIQFI
ncbi:MAG: ATP-binding cassette domain-containing protein [Magnetococcales bacterium]|nr:ATP-binding cassette domain-containing protein [Magnetococcales bacterium]